MPLKAGTILTHRYRIDELLGQGGFGAVYRAWDLNLDEPVALKESFETSPAAQRQFQLEAKLLFKLRHTHLPRVHDFFILPEQGMYLVMDYVEGQDLGARLEQAGGPLPVAEVARWAGQVCQALEYLHTQEPAIIHRDIKPANIRITPKGQAVLVDFGIAKVYDPAVRTTVGARAVTPGYSPFEQYGRSPTDERSDLYALGATLYHLLSGEAPPDAPDRAAGKELRRLGEANPGVSAGLQAAVERALAMRPDERFQSAAELGQALAKAVVQLPAGAQPVVRTAPVNLEGAAGPVRTLPAPVPESPAATYPLPTGRGKTGRVAFPWRWLAIGAAGLVGIVLLAWALVGGLGGNGGPDLAEQTAQALATLTMESRARETQAAVPEGMVLIPAGDFRMGSTDADSQADSDEKPQHTVYLDAFSIDLYEVTNRLYAECVAAGVCTPPQDTTSFTRSSYYDDPQYADYPVIYVDWNQARAYCQWRGGDLPTEAQWEKAARGTDGRIYPWGNQSPTCDLANYWGRDGGCVGDTTAVGSYPDGKSPYGLFDLAGNVWEWVLDWYQSDYYSSQSTWENPFGPSRGESRVLRGGAWSYSGRLVRSAARAGTPPPISAATSASVAPALTDSGMLAAGRLRF